MIVPTRPQVTVKPEITLPAMARLPMVFLLGLHGSEEGVEEALDESRFQRWLVVCVILGRCSRLVVKQRRWR